MTQSLCSNHLPLYLVNYDIMNLGGGGVSFWGENTARVKLGVEWLLILKMFENKQKRFSNSLSIGLGRYELIRAKRMC